MKEFTTAVADVTEQEAGDDGSVQFTLDGVELVVRRPKDGQIAMLMANTGRHTSEATKIAGIIDFFVSVMDDRSHGILVDRLLDYNDPFGLEQVEEIMMWLIEEWSGRPTPPPSVSTTSQRNGGPKSKQPTSA